MTSKIIILAFVGIHAMGVRKMKKEALALCDSRLGAGKGGV
jgi:hypothetical protein